MLNQSEIERIKRDADDLGMLMNPIPELWPNWPFLPLKRYDKSKPGLWPEAGFVIAEYPNIVIQVNMFADLETIIKSERKEYENVEAVIADGWMVD